MIIIMRLKTQTYLRDVSGGSFEQLVLSFLVLIDKCIQSFVVVLPPSLETQVYREMKIFE